MAMEHTELLKIDRPADVVWEWMSDARNVLSINFFHERGDWPERIDKAGMRVDLPHNFWGLHRERRGATIRSYRKYHISYGDYKLKDEPGVDTFPHNQSFTVIPVDDDSCIVMNQIKGVYVWPVPRFVREWAFRKFMPVILHDDLLVIAAAVGVGDPSKIKKPLGTLMWPFMVAFGSKFIKSSSRTKIVNDAKTFQPKTGSGTRRTTEV